MVSNRQIKNKLNTGRINNLWQKLMIKTKFLFYPISLRVGFREGKWGKIKILLEEDLLAETIKLAKFLFVFYKLLNGYREGK